MNALSNRLTTAIIASIGLITIISGCSESADDQKKDTNIRNIVQSEINSEHMNAGWKRIYIQEMKDKDVAVYLEYNQDPPNGDNQPEYDTREVAQHILDALVSAGYRPAQEEIRLSVWSEQGGVKTVTGEPGVIPYGQTIYSYNDDALNWLPYKK